MLQLDLATAEYIGARPQQQDLAAALPLPGGAMLVLADGLGGHESGAEAARIVVETFREAGAGGRFASAATRRQALREVLDLANARIAEGVDPAHGHRGMASTAVAAVVAEGDLSWVSVGDSHLYLSREGKLHKLNEDHSQAAVMVKSGQYHPDDPEVQAVKSVLVSALTGRRLEIVDLPTSTVQLEAGDIVILASDGLNTLADEDIEHIIEDAAAHGAVQLSTTLLESVRSRRVERQDNTTVVVARILASEAKPAHATKPAPTAVEAETQAVHVDESDEARTERVVAAEHVLPEASPQINLTASSEVGANGAGADAAGPPDEVVAPRIVEARGALPKGARSHLEPVSPAEAAATTLSAVRGGRSDGTPNRQTLLRFVLLAVALLLGGLAVAALRPGWLTGVVPGMGAIEASPPAQSATKGEAPAASADRPGTSDAADPSGAMPAPSPARGDGAPPGADRPAGRP